MQDNRSVIFRIINEQTGKVKTQDIQEYRSDALPVAQPTASRHWREKVSHSTDLLTPSSPVTLSSLSGPLKVPGYLAFCCQYPRQNIWDTQKLQNVTTDLLCNNTTKYLSLLLSSKSICTFKFAYLANSVVLPARSSASVVFAVERCLAVCPSVTPLTGVSRSLYTYKSNISKTVHFRDKVTLVH